MNDIFSVYPNLKELWLWGNPGISETSRYSKVLGTLKFSQRGIFWLQFRGYSCARTDGTSKLALDDKFARRCGKCIKIIQEAKNEGMNLSVTQARKPEWIKEIWIIHSEIGMTVIISHPPPPKGHYPVQEDTKRVTRPECSNDPEAQTKAIAAVEEYTKTFNRMRCIETDERDLVYEVLCSIIDYMNNPIIDKARLLDRFEELRDF